jgi:alkanesulfonate monooxygenase SsuD/methylene tetrahydromethanopterin reductase-like flavin-dependent oxidoreductase (luciferase family)
MAMQDVSFGFQAAAAGETGRSDQDLYRDMMDDCALGSRLGYDAAWLLEHHFSDYYPTPSPMLLMSHIAARFPDLSFGTSVLVLPRYHPLRLAEEIAMLNSLTRGTLHLGIGRGTARMEYDAYNIDMNEGRARVSRKFTKSSRRDWPASRSRTRAVSGISIVRSACAPAASTSRSGSTVRSEAPRAQR